ncbi:hypothetical protein BGX38DRAFT_1269609 [Terfezia claveryi]|nr:hypothetical protein BGX38DRAFT_1269609 [Terfezia claveryi]
MSIEALASYVLDEIALDGDNGTSIPKLFDYVRQFYHNHRQRRFRIANLFESGPAVLVNDDPQAEEAVDDSNFFSTQDLDLELRKEIWKRLVSDLDFKVGKNNEGSTLELEEVEEVYEQIGADTQKGKEIENIVDAQGIEGVTGGDVETGSQAVEPSSQAIGVESEAIEPGSQAVEEAKATKMKKWRVYASLEQRWKSLTGHGVDHKKIPPKFFDLLTEIGRHREKGILQPTLTKVTNQDARSVGPRTAALAKMGYIEKVNVLAAKLRTSKLTLQCYATLRDLKENKLKKKAKEAGTKVDKNSANAQWTGDTVDVRKMVEAIFAVLRQAKNQVLMHSDIKRKLGMDKSRFHFRAFARIIRRVEKTGCLKRIRVPLKLTRHKKTRTIPTGFTDKCLARCIKLIREPNEQDWEQTLSVTLKRDADDVEDENGEGGNEGDDDGEKDNDQDDELDHDAVAKLENVEGDLVEESSRIIPSWVPDRSLENIIYDAVDAAGVDGVSSMDLHQIVAGRFYYRPLDQVLRRLGDNPLKSQPPHLLRLAIIRETGIEGRHTHYRYFSYRWHDKLVKAGLGKPVGGPKKAHVKGKKKEEEKQREKEEAAPKRVTVATDDLGFSFVDKRRLLKGDGSCTIKEAQEKLAAPESAHILKGRYVIETTEGGRSSVRWSGWNRAPKVPGTEVKNTGGTVRRGRPPNWLKETMKRAAESVEVKEMPPPPPLKKRKTDENGATIPSKPRGRPKKPDHLLKNPRKPSRYVPRIRVEPEESTRPVVPEEPMPSESERFVGLSVIGLLGEDVAVTERHRPVPQHQVAARAAEEPTGLDVDMEDAADNETVPHRKETQRSHSSPPATVDDALQPSVPQSPAPEPTVVQTSAPKRRGRPPKNKYAAKNTPKETNKRKVDTPTAKKITEFLQKNTVESAKNTCAKAAASDAATRETVMIIPKTRAAKAKLLNTLQAPKEPVKEPIKEPVKEHVRETVASREVGNGAESVNAEMLDALPLEAVAPVVQEIPLGAREPAVLTASVTPDTTSKASRRAQSTMAPPERAKRRRSTRFTASEDAMEEAILLTPTVQVPDPAPIGSPHPEPASPEGTPTPSIPTTAEGTPIPVLKGKMYRTKPATKYRLPRSEPTMVLEEIDDTPKMSYGSAGGMLMIARQRVILELMEENGGVFPGGLEIKHAFESRYKRKNPKAGQPDRRLMVSLVSSLQRNGKINQIVINFINSRGLRQTKRILADSKLPLDHPLILQMKNNIVAADGNLWFPEGTEIPKEAQKLANSVRGLPTQPGAIESVEFERMFVPPRKILQAQRAEAARQKRLSRIEKEHEFPRFTAEQKELAAKRLEYRRRRAALTALAKRVDYVEGDDDAWDAPSDNQMEVEPQTKSKWWGGLVDRPDVQELNQVSNFVPAPGPGPNVVIHPANGIPDPTQEKDFLNGVRKVYSWETKQVFAEDELHTYFGFNMINHFCRGPDTTGSTDFTPERASMSNLIFQPDFRKGKGNLFTAKKYGRRRKKALKALDMSENVQKPKRRRLIGPRQKRTRREKAMAELHHGQPVDEEDAALEELPQKSQIIPRKRHLFDYEQDDVLLAAIVIVRTLFGGFDRRIDWALVSKAFPDHDLPTLKARWPRVRDAHKTHLKKLQIDFEEVYLDAYERGEMPEIARGEIGDFDLPWHCRWFKDNVTVPDAKSVPSLTKSREAFNSLYDLRAEKPSWRDEYHNPALTGAQRTNFMSSHPYECQMFATKSDERPYEDAEANIECIKSLIKANILTDISVYDARRAFEMLSSYSVENVDTAFYFLTGNKTLAPKKDAEKLVPGRNYEFTERFHLSLRVPVGGRMWEQATQFEKLIGEEFCSSSGGNGNGKGKVKVGTLQAPSSPRGQLPSMSLSPFMNDGSMMALLNLVANRRITLDKSRYVSSVHGLVPGYRTRSMEKAMIDFPIMISPTELYYCKPMAPPPPPAVNSVNWKEEPVRLWYDIMGNLVHGMWRKCCAAVLGTVVTRPGIRDAEVVKVLWPGLTMTEVETVGDWLEKAGVLENRVVEGVKARFVKDEFWWGLGDRERRMAGWDGSAQDVDETRE